MIAPPGATACSWQGFQFGIADGRVTVPGESVEDLRTFGFTKEPTPAA